MLMTDRTRVQIWWRDKFKCRYCDYDAGASFEAFRRARLAVDHLKPRRHGGTDDENNLFTCCAACNAEKGQKDFNLGAVEEVRRYLRLYWTECYRPWFDTFVAAKDGPKDPLTCWDGDRRGRKLLERFDAGDDER